VAAAVILPADIQDRLNRSTFWSTVWDSKTLAPPRRSELAHAIRNEALDFGIGIVPVEDLDVIGLGAANRLSMELAVADLDAIPDALLLDAMTIDTGIDQIGIVDGDALSLSIAAASIVAKVYRDALMASLDRQDQRYGFARHKGYGVPSHLQAIAEHGPCAHHRMSFAPVRRALERKRDR
jgi:ribonuclease HII